MLKRVTYPSHLALTLIRSKKASIYLLTHVHNIMSQTRLLPSSQPPALSHKQLLHCPGSRGRQGHVEAQGAHRGEGHLWERGSAGRTTCGCCCHWAPLLLLLLTLQELWLSCHARRAQRLRRSAALPALSNCLLLLLLLLLIVLLLLLLLLLIVLLLLLLLLLLSIL